MIAFFDFDGTLTAKDSMIDFIQYAVGRRSYYLGLLSISPILAAYKLNLISNHVAKERFIAFFFKEWDFLRFQKIADKYSIERIDKIIRPKAMEKIIWHQGQGHKVVVVSASIECWLKKWCEKNNVDLIATQLEIKKDKITGKFATKNCYGIEKVNRIKKKYDLSEFDFIYAYGDSPGDKDMLSIANERHYKYFN